MGKKVRLIDFVYTHTQFLASKIFNDHNHESLHQFKKNSMLIVFFPLNMKQENLLNVIKGDLN